MNFKKTKIAIIGAVTALAMVGGVAVLPAFAADDVAAQIATLMAQIQMLQAKLAASSSVPAVGSYNFATNLTLGSTGADVMNLQKVLNSDVATQVAASGVGSAGNESSYFGGLTKAAVMKFQTKYGISPVAGYVGAITRAKLNSMSAGAPVVVTPGVPATPGVAGTLVVTGASMQPANALAPLGATRIPFTKFTVTAGATDVPLTNVTVERVGSSIDSSLDSIVLLDENGVQIGISKTLNSTHRASVGEPIVIKAGTSRTFTIGANRPSTAVANTGGTIVGLDLVAVNTTASVLGDVLPIKGATHTINDNLAIGTVTMARGSIDPGSSQTKEIGSVGYTFSSVKVTAGSAEALTLKSVRWNQFGSASIADLANVKTYVDGVAYDAVTTDGGKYYTSTFGNGIMVDKGFSKDISIKGDIVGGSSRTIRFDIAKRTDVNLVGNIYGYGILPPQSANCGTDSCFTTSEDPWYKGSTVTMSNGTISASTDNTVPAQNIAVNLANQPFGGWSVEVRGEPISISKMIFTNATNSTDIINVVLVDGNGSVLGGPVDATANTLTFTDSVTFPVGITKIAIKGKLGTTFSTNDTIQLTTTPSTQWTTVRGQVTGNSITPSTSAALTASAMTVKAGALAISQSPQPSAQTVIAGATQYEFARYILDAGQSGEDLRVTSFMASTSASGGTVSPSSLSNCQLYDNGVSVTTGSNSKNPTANGDQTFTFDGTGLTIPRGTSKTLALKCNVTSGVTGNVIWGLVNNAATYSAASGLASGQTIVETMAASNGQIMTLNDKGSYTVAKNSNSAYLYKAVRSGTEVTLGAFDFTAGASEDVMLKQVALILGFTASNSPSDLANDGAVTLWDGNTLIDTVQFNNSDYATSTLDIPVKVTKSGTKTIVVKGTFLYHELNKGTPGAYLSVNYDGNNNGLNGNYASGVESQAVVNGGTTGVVATNGVRVFRTVPVFTVLSTSGAFPGDDVDAYKFKIENPDSTRGLVLNQLTFSVGTSTAGSAAINFKLVDATTGEVANVGGTAVQPLGVTDAQTVTITFATGDIRIVPAGSSRTYALRLKLTDVASVGESVTLSLKGDVSYAALPNLMGTVAQLSSSKIVWSPVSTTSPASGETAAESNLDWTNGYGLAGFPTVGTGDFGTVNFQRN